jgi:hypothetical protein
MVGWSSPGLSILVASSLIALPHSGINFLVNTRKLMPECGNVIRELATSMDNPGDEHWRAMKRLMGYISKFETVELRLMKPRDLKVYAYVDSNYATNKETRKSVTGYVLTIVRRANHRLPMTQSCKGTFSQQFAL